MEILGFTKLMTLEDFVALYLMYMSNDASYQIISYQNSRIKKDRSKQMVNKDRDKDKDRDCSWTKMGLK